MTEPPLPGSIGSGPPQGQPWQAPDSDRDPGPAPEPGPAAAPGSGPAGEFGAEAALRAAGPPYGPAAQGSQPYAPAPYGAPAGPAWSVAVPVGPGGGHPGTGYPPGGRPVPYPTGPGWPAVPVAPAVRSTAGVLRVEPVAGTPFGVAYPPVSPTVSGLAVGSMVAGIGAVLVSAVVWCFGLALASRGLGGLVSGAFAVLAVLVGGAAVVTGLVARRQIGRAPTELRGKGLAVAGISTGAAGVGLTLAGFLVALAVSAGH